MNIKRKILLFSIVWLVVMLLLINGFIFLLFQKNIFDNETQRVTEHTRTVVAATNQAIAVNGDIRALLRAYLPTNGMIRIITEETTSILTISKEGYMLELPTKYQNQQSVEVRTFHDVPYAVVSFPIIWTDGSVVMLEVTESLEGSKNLMRSLLIVLTIASLMVLVPALFLGNMLSRLILTPIKVLTNTMKQIQATGEYKKIELNSASKDELYTMGETFNRMIDILEQNYQKQHQFVSDASHELKTPLTVIESYASMLKRWGMKKPELLEEAVEAIYSEAVRMKDMTEQMLQLANEDSKFTLEIKEVDLLTLCQQASQHIEVSFKREIFILEEGNSYQIWADENKLKQVVYILLDNARKYSQDSITIKLAEQENTCSFSIIDKGIGIPNADSEKIFDRFYRVDKARTRETGGVGLGLSIAKKIIDAHDGTITLASVEGTGTGVTVTLPKFSGGRNVNEIEK
ncbi:HAMP domain-containing histidine kinase [Anaerobacillus sp. CMMVII]|uniref:sensor histidine kinase n=1 Tax=Anaerobacillus sp. CMMVII TaxID=2755588 RepID=UPI0021B82A22|nr:HAMP domain-containing sensor histidine kinase [Anaerobacillus sp. CMMVII]MCT8136609.1 HAMP domain-containing histidine kinase [Anaerobacillus sp. CMMVII]